MPAAPSTIGSKAELMVALRLMAAGKSVYLPLFGAHSRVDLIFEDDEGLYRVQCKSSRIVRGVVTFRTCSNTKNRPKAYRGEIDFFGVYSPEHDAVYLVPIGDVPDRVGSLRVDPARNGQAKRLRWARDYLVRGLD